MRYATASWPRANGPASNPFALVGSFPLLHFFFPLHLHLAHSRLRCTDVDECSSSWLNECPQYSDCINTDPGYSCGAVIVPGSIVNSNSSSSSGGSGGLLTANSTAGGDTLLMKVYLGARGLSGGGGGGDAQLVAITHLTTGAYPVQWHCSSFRILAGSSAPAQLGLNLTNASTVECITGPGFGQNFRFGVVFCTATGGAACYQSTSFAEGHYSYPLPVPVASTLRLGGQPMAMGSVALQLASSADHWEVEFNLTNLPPYWPSNFPEPLITLGPF